MKILKSISFFLFFIPFSLFSHSMVAHHTNLRTGELEVITTDHVVKAGIPLEIRRKLFTLPYLYATHPLAKMIETAGVFSHMNLYLSRNSDGTYYAEIIEPLEGKVSYNDYKHEYNRIYMKYGSKDKRGPSLSQSYRSNPRNNRLIFYRNKTATLSFCNGSKRYYEGIPHTLTREEINAGIFSGLSHRYRLTKEISASGQITKYCYEGNDLVKVQKVLPSSGKVVSEIILTVDTSADSTYVLNIKTSLGEEMKYFGEVLYGKLRITSFEKEGFPKKTFAYGGNTYFDEKENLSKCKKSSALLTSFSLNNNTYTVDWKKDQVKHIYKNGEKLASFLFDYQEVYHQRKFSSINTANNRLSSFARTNVVTTHLFKGWGQAIDAFGNSICIFYDQGQPLDKTLWKNKYGVLLKAEYNTWKNDAIAEKTIVGHSGCTVQSILFTYDKYLNVIQKVVKNPRDKTLPSVSTLYRYNDEHLLIKEQTGDLKIHYKYHENTNLISEKKLGSVVEKYIYDDDLFLKAKKLLPQVKNNQYLFHKQENYQYDDQTKMVTCTNDGLKEIYYEYDDKNQLIKEQTILLTSDPQNPYKDSYDCTYEYSYNEQGRMIQKTFPSGAINFYEYDERGNITKAKEVGSAEKEFIYDKNNLPISCTIAGRTSTNTYDIKGNLLEEVNYKGATTSYEYDTFDRCIKKTLPAIEIDGEWVRPSWKYSYDIFGNVTKKISPLGNTTTITYNLLNKPIKIFFPDGSFLSHTYDLYGNLIKTKDQEGYITKCKYDAFGRCIRKKAGDIEEQWKYVGLLLKSYKDARGLITKYEYDHHGRKVREIKDRRIKSFHYDGMGNICRITEGELEEYQFFNIEGNVIETCQNGFNQIRYEYNEEGKKAKAIKRASQGDAEDCFFYDFEGNLSKHIDPTGAETLFISDGWTRTEIDPLGNRTIETFDTHDRVIKKEKLSKDDEVLLCEKTVYDLDGNVILATCQDLEVEYTYDNMGRVTHEVEAKEKETSYSYDKKGRVTCKTLPNKKSLYYEYNCHDQKTRIKSSDNSVNYLYKYSGPDLIMVMNNISSIVLTRSYSCHGQIYEEKLCTKDHFLHTKWFHDKYGRKKAIYLTDGSAIYYSYIKNCMHSVTRLNKEGKVVYKHTYTKFDPNQHVVEEELPMGLGTQTCSHNILELTTNLSSPFHEIALNFNDNHLVTFSENSLTGNKDYEYDDLSQLTKEGELSYEFDALGNSKEFSINQLNQITSSKEETFTYDKNGNLISRSNGTTYKYDALDRLISITHPSGKTTTFIYDPFSRLITKKEEGKAFHFLYDLDTEIGMMNKKKEILQLKVLGLGLKGDIGAAIAIEIKGQPFVPLHDLQGNIIGIANIHGEIEEQYPMNAFGEEESSNFINPWRFSSKRYESGLIYFGMRFYEPQLKRWLTPDPAGFLDSRNLYIFNHNSPVNRLDQFGLSSSFILDVPTGQTLPPYDHYAFQAEHYFSDGPWFSSSLWHGSGGKAEFFGLPAEVALFCTRKVRFAFSIEDRINGSFNWMRFAPELIKGAKNCIAIVTYQPGIMNQYEDFMKMGHFLSNILPEGALTVGIHNQSEGFLKDLCRARSEQKGTFTDIVKSTAAFFTEMLDWMDQNAPEAYWLHVLHSEAGAIAFCAYFYLNEKHQTMMQKYGLVAAIAPAMCFSNLYCVQAKNYYSKADNVTSWFAEKPSIDYDILHVDPITKRWDRQCFLFDHAFMGPTYESVLKNNVMSFAEEYGGFYVGSTR